MPIKATMCKQARKYSSAGVSVGRSFYYLFPQNHRLPEAPKVGQHVSIEGQPGVYVVLRLDKKRFAADLMLTTGNHAIEHNVPYFAIEAVRSNGEAEAPVKYATG